MTTDKHISAQEQRHGPGVRIHPPLIYATSIVCGIGLNKLWPQAMPFGIQGAAYATAILAAVLLLAGLCIYEFYKAGTDVRPDTPDSALITSGPYCVTRNPLYIGLTLVQIAAAVWLDNAWVLGMTLVSVYVIGTYAIRREERYLQQLFGQAYLDYKQQVRRWL